MKQWSSGYYLFISSNKVLTIAGDTLLRQNQLPGYKGRVLELLEKIDARVGCRIRLSLKNNMFIDGILMPKHELSHTDTIIIKLDNGYNIGVNMDNVLIAETIECKERVESSYTETLELRNLSKVKILGCGGTIASKVEYETGAVKPAMSPSELIELIPELKELANYDFEVIFNILSEDMTPKHWEVLAGHIHRSLSSGVNGIVVTHGTDTMSYTASAIAFALRNLPTPIAFVGAQRSSDRPSTDAALNLLAAVITTLNAPFGESVVVMHSFSSDLEVYVHRGVKVRKMHSSRRDAFQSINDIPLASIDLQKYSMNILNNRYIPRKSIEELTASIGFDDRVALVKAYPGFQSEIIDVLIDRKFHGIVIEGTGLGHIGSYTIDAVKRAIEEGIPVVMTTQTLLGRVNMNVYTTGRKLLEVGVIPGDDMLPEVAYVKLSWILFQTRDLNKVKEMMTTNYVNEINPRHILELFQL